MTRALRRPVAGRRRGGLRRRYAVAAAGAALAVAGLGAWVSPASAEYTWGCTYSYPNTCFGPWGANDFLITMDPDHALWLAGTNNGYPKPKWDGRERYVCGSVWSGGPGTSIPWSCAWREDVYTFPWINGRALIASSLAYSRIALYQVIDYSQNGP